MMSLSFWDQIKQNANVTRTAEIVTLDRLLGQFHQIAKTDLENRLRGADELFVAARNMLNKKTEIDGILVATEILICSALDTYRRLELDVNAQKISLKSGMMAKPLDKAHRHELLDPKHHRWGVAKYAQEFKGIRKIWKEHLLYLASNPGAAGIVVASFYDWLGTMGRTEPKARTKYLTPYEQQKKRLVFVNPGQINPMKETLIYRQKKGQGGKLDVYDSKGGWRIFVMLEDRAFYACAVKETAQGVTHHSGLANGQTILGAGAMKVVQGNIVQITQQSGHYRPNPDQVLNVLKVLAELGIDLTKIRLKAYTYFNDPHHLKPDQQNPDDLFADEQPVLASYYLYTKGAWAWDPDAYRGSKLNTEAAAVEQIADRFRAKLPPLAQSGSLSNSSRPGLTRSGSFSHSGSPDNEVNNYIHPQLLSKQQPGSKIPVQQQAQLNSQYGVWTPLKSQQGFQPAAPAWRSATPIPPKLGMPVQNGFVKAAVQRINAATAVNKPMETFYVDQVPIRPNRPVETFYIDSEPEWE